MANDKISRVMNADVAPETIYRTRPKQGYLMKKLLSIKTKSNSEAGAVSSFGQAELTLRTDATFPGANDFVSTGSGDQDNKEFKGWAEGESKNHSYGVMGQEQRASMQELIDNLPVFAAAAQPNGVITFVNEYALRETGCRREDLIGKLLWSPLWWSRDFTEYEAIQKYFESCLAGNVLHFDLPYRSSLRGDEQRWLDLRLKPQFENGREGAVKCVLISGTDISERVRQENERSNAIRESEINFRRLADTLPQIIWTANAQGEINYTNSQWKDYLNSTKANDWSSFVHSEDREKARQAWLDSLSSGSPLEVDIRLRGNNGGYRWFLMRAVPTHDKNHRLTGWCGSAFDIEDRKIQAKELSDAKSEADRANATKSAFLANMSHEIRTPLGAILGFTDLLRDPNTGPEERLGYLDIISRNGKALTRVIDDILDLSNVEAGHLEIEQMPFSLPDLLSEITSLFSETVKAKRLYLTLAIDSNVPNHVLSDPARLRQILINIIGNAVKFTSLGGIKVKVESALLKTGKSKITISVSDTGPGLLRSQQKKLFQPFTQADNTTTRKYGGTGLGLALSRRLAQAMGGNIAISECKLRRGCTFQITIEVDHPHNETKLGDMIQPVQVDGGVLAKARVLLVEDAIDNQILIRRILTKKGAQVDIANNGMEGVEKALAGDYSIVLMDIQMPIMDGYEAIQKLRSLGYKGTVYALTAHAMAEERKKTHVAGYDGHLTKPLDTEVLVKTVRQHIVN